MHWLLWRQKAEKIALAQNYTKKYGFLQVLVFTQFWRGKRNKGNKSWLAEVCDLKSPGREDEQRWRKPVLAHVVPWGHVALAQSAPSSETKTKALLGGSLRNLPFPQQSVFPAKC